MFYNEDNSIYFSESNYKDIMQEYFQKKSKNKSKKPNYSDSSSKNSEKPAKDKPKKKDYSKDRERKRSYE